MKKIFVILFLAPLFCFGQPILTTTNHQTVTNKTMDYNNNTFLNFPSAPRAVDTIWRVPGTDSIYFKISGTTYRILDSINVFSPSTLTISSPLTGTSYNATSPVSIGINQANGSTNGYLASTDWTTFNNKLSKAVDTIWRTPGVDSIKFTINGTTY